MVPVKCMLHIFLFHVVRGSKRGRGIPSAPYSVRTGAVLNSDHMARCIYWHDAGERDCALLSYPFYHFHRNWFIFDLVYSAHLTECATRSGWAGAVPRALRDRIKPLTTKGNTSFSSKTPHSSYRRQPSFCLLDVSLGAEKSTTRTCCSKAKGTVAKPGLRLGLRLGHLRALTAAALSIFW